MALPEVGPADRGLIIPSGCIFVIHVLPTAFFVFAPVLVLPAVGHGGTFQSKGRSKPLVGDYGLSEVGFPAPLCQAALGESLCESARRLLKTASETRLLRHRRASLRDLPSPIFLR
jgi:hypothetical protein